jgi:hypothetical protein
VLVCIAHSRINAPKKVSFIAMRQQEFILCIWDSNTYLSEFPESPGWYRLCCGAFAGRPICPPSKHAALPSDNVIVRDNHTRSDREGHPHGLAAERAAAVCVGDVEAKSNLAIGLSQYSCSIFSQSPFPARDSFRVFLPTLPMKTSPRRL